MITYCDCSNPILNQQIIDQLIIQLKNSDVENYRDFLKLFPPIKQLIQMIPSSLPLLDIIVTKSLKFHKNKSNKAAFHYDELFNYLLWWIAYNERKSILQNETSKMKIAKIPFSENDLSSANCEDWEKYVRSILAAIKTESPGILEAARCIELRLANSLEALGCHGLINYSEGLIGLLDAVRLEVSDHYKKIKEISEQFNDLKTVKHQFDNVASTESVQESKDDGEPSFWFLISGALNDLSSLLRIVRRRLICDQTLIKMYKMIVKSAPSGYTILDTDPVAADVIATFQIAYHKLLSLVDHQYNTYLSNDNHTNQTNHEDEYQFLLSASDSDVETNFPIIDLSSKSQIAISSMFRKNNYSTLTTNNIIPRYHSLNDLCKSSCNQGNELRSARSMSSLDDGD
ncbi:unnamed protein product [Onchocerca flexuosa]|uniref:Uncharacterized protein n=1 Tax=Onchocerca flexuosa TaxID=387005 RepID=A0A183H747_9BILA|nr:unnamed protein product [Onchocerca flexuosa]